MSNPSPVAVSTHDAIPLRGCAGILLVDDHDLVRLGFRALVQSQSAADAESAAITVFEARTLREAISLYEAQQQAIGVVVLDLGLPDTQGLSGVADFRTRFPQAAVVVLSGTSSAALVQGALALGVRAFLPKSGDLGEVARFVHACAVHGPESASRLLASLSPGAVAAGAASLPSASANALSGRQTQILQWVLEGRSNKEIAQMACLSEGTVKNHVSTLLLQFDSRSRAQLISKLRS